MDNYEYLRGSINPKNSIDVLKYKIEFGRSHPDYFYPEGLLVFCGPQGSGKTLSAVSYIKKIFIDYPKAKFVTNVEIKGLPIDIDITFFKSQKELIHLLSSVKNDDKGVVFFIDEIHSFFNCLMSKNIPLSVISEISQQRKQRTHIIGTSQVYSKMARPLREQIKNVVICTKHLGCIQWNKLIDGEASKEVNGVLKYDIKKRFLWFHSPKQYKDYDTSAVIKAFSDNYDTSLSHGLYNLS